MLQDRKKKKKKAFSPRGIRVITIRSEFMFALRNQSNYQQ